MSLDLVIGATGLVVTLLVVVGMILITPHGATTRPRPAGSSADADADADPDVVAPAPPAPSSTTGRREVAPLG